MKRSLCNALLLVCSCSTFAQESLSIEDFLLKNFIVKEFDIPGYKQDEIDSILLREKIPAKEIIIYPGQYKLRVYEFHDPFGYTPFAIKVLDKKDSLITFFTFTDELFYRNNDVKGKFDYAKNRIDLKTAQGDTRTLNNRNLNDNLNTLIQIVGYQHNEVDIRNLMDVIFIDLLRMKPVNYHEIKDLSSRLSKIKTDNPVIKQCIEEFSNLNIQCKLSSMCLSAKEGSPGYWSFSIEQQHEDFIVKAKFIGDLIYEIWYF